MLPNFTVVICGAVLTVLMLAVAGSGLIDPQTRTRIGAMPEISRPMMQGMITEPAARAQFAALEASRRAEELMRLRDLAPAVAEPVPSAEHNDPDQPAAESAAPAPQPSSNTSAAPAASAEADPPAVVDAAPSVAEVPPAVDEEAPAVAAETAAAAVAQAVPGTDGVAAPIGDPTPPTAADAAPAPDPAGAPAPQATSLAVEPAVDPTPAAPPIAPQRAAPDSVVAATSFTEAPVTEAPAAADHGEHPAAADHNERPAEPSLSALQQLALADPDAVPAPEAPAKLAARTGEPDEAEPVRRWVPRLLQRLPRINPGLSRLSRPHLAHAAPRVTPRFVRHVHARSKAEAAKQDIAKGAAAPKKPLRHWVRQSQHRAQRASVAPDAAPSPNPAYTVTSGVQYR